MIKAVHAVVGLGLLCFGATQAVVAATDISKLPRVNTRIGGSTKCARARSGF